MRLAPAALVAAAALLRAPLPAGAWRDHELDGDLAEPGGAAAGIGGGAASASAAELGGNGDHPFTAMAVAEAPVTAASAAELGSGEGSGGDGGDLKEAWGKQTKMTEQSVKVAVAIAEFAKDASVKKGGAAIAQVGALMMSAIPPPAGIVAGGALSLVGGLMTVFGPKTPTDSEILLKNVQVSIDKHFADMRSALHRLDRVAKKILVEVQGISNNTVLCFDKYAKVQSACTDGLHQFEDWMQQDRPPVEQETTYKFMKEYFIEKRNKFVAYRECFEPSHLANILVTYMSRSAGPGGGPYAAVLAYRRFIAARSALWVILTYSSVFKVGHWDKAATRHTEDFKNDLVDYSKVLRDGVRLAPTSLYYEGFLGNLLVNFTEMNLANLSDSDLDACASLDEIVESGLISLRDTTCRARVLQEMWQKAADLAAKCGPMGRKVEETLARRSALRLASTGGLPDLLFMSNGGRSLRSISKCNPQKAPMLSSGWNADWQNGYPRPVPDGRGGAYVVSLGSLYHVTKNQPKPPESKVWSSGWAPRTMAPDGQGGLFIISRGTFYHVHKDRKNGELWSTGWDPYFMVPDGGRGVFVLSRNNLYHVTGPGRHEKWSTGWDPDAAAMDGKGGLFVISGGNLYHVTRDRKSPAVQDRWSQGWHCAYDTRTQEMVHDGQGGLFIVSWGYLYHIREATRWSERWSSSWAKPEWMQPDLNGGVFLSHRGGLWHITESNKDGEIWPAA